MLSVRDRRSGGVAVVAMMPFMGRFFARDFLPESAARLPVQAQNRETEIVLGRIHVG